MKLARLQTAQREELHLGGEVAEHQQRHRVDRRPGLDRALIVLALQEQELADVLAVLLVEAAHLRIQLASEAFNSLDLRPLPRVLAADAFQPSEAAIDGAPTAENCVCGAASSSRTYSLSASAAPLTLRCCVGLRAV